MQTILESQSSCELNRFPRAFPIRPGMTILGAAILSLAYSLVVGQTVQAATRVVTNTLDSGTGSLREQVAAAASGDTLTFSVTGVITLTSGEIVLDKNLSIDGPGAEVLEVSGDGASRVFSVTTGSSVQILGLTIQKGNALHGGGIMNYGSLALAASTLKRNAATNYGGGIFNEGTLTVTGSTFFSNTAMGGGGVYNGGLGKLMLISSTLDSNFAIGGAGAMNSGSMVVMGSTLLSNFTRPGSGGGIANYAVVTLTNSILVSNTATFAGGGIENYSGARLSVVGSSIVSNSSINGGGAGLHNDGTVTIDHSAVSGNTIDSFLDIQGGGIYNGSGTLTVYFSTVSHNQVSSFSLAYGGGIYNGSGTATVNNSTLAENSLSAQTSSGGCIYNAAGQVTVNNSTLAGCNADTGGGIGNNGVLTSTFSTLDGNMASTSGGGVANGGELTIHGTILAESGNGNCDGSLASEGYNLSDDSTCTSFTATGDINDTSPLLGLLKDNGGPTLTMMPASDSAVIDAGGDTCPSTDQRGFSRPQGAHCDIGAVEVQAHFLFLPAVTVP